MPAHALSLRHVTIDVQRRDVTGRRTGILRVLDGCSLDVGAGESLAIVGPLACGKSTLLDVLAGFARPVTGEAYADGAPIVRPALDNGFVAPAYGLFPWRTALANVTFALGSGGTPEARDARALEALDLVGLMDLAESPVSQLMPPRKSASPSRRRWRTNRAYSCSMIPSPGLIGPLGGCSATISSASGATQASRSSWRRAASTRPCASATGWLCSPRARDGSRRLSMSIDGTTLRLPIASG